jgi:hypothetical protein
VDNVKITRWFAVSAIALLAACGPAEVDQAAQSAAAEAGVAIPSGAADEAASALASAVAGLEQDAAGLLNDADLQALANEAVTTVQGLTPSDLRLQQDQPLVLDTTQQVADVSNYRWVITQSPAGAESVRGTVIEENSNGKLTIEPSDYAKYFPVAGDYTVDLELTYANGNKERSPIPIIVP